MTREEILSALPDDVCLLEPRDVFDPALIGYTDTPKDRWGREPGHRVAVYSEQKCLVALMEYLGESFEQALEYYEFNIEGAYVGHGTPTFVDEEADPEEDDDGR